VRKILSILNVVRFVIISNEQKSSRLNMTRR